MASSIREINLRSRHIVGPLLAALALVYFGYHLVQGDRGLITWVQRSQQIKDLTIELNTLKKHQVILSHKASLLRPESLDLDLLDERARIVLNFVRKDEVVLYNR